MRLRIWHTAALHERSEQALVRALIEGRQREPLFERCEGLSRVDSAGRQLAQEVDVQGAKAQALRGEPARELGAAIDLEPFEQVAAE